MNLSNIGGNDLPRKNLSLADDMAAFDALPQSLKVAIREASVPWGADSAEYLVKAYGPGVALRTFAKVEGDLQAAHRAKVLGAERWKASRCA